MFILLQFINIYMLYIGYASEDFLDLFLHAEDTVALVCLASDNILCQRTAAGCTAGAAVKTGQGFCDPVHLYTHLDSGLFVV